MIKPTFSCGAYTASPEHPSGRSIRPVHGGITAVTLGGTTRKDMPWRKYVYTLDWESMSLTDYQNLRTLINYHNDTGTPMYFSYEKFQESSTVIEVTVPPLERDGIKGKGTSGYYQSVTLEITEVNPR